MGRLIIFVVSAALAILRVAGEKGEIFQAVAHVWVGGLCGAWLMGRLHGRPLSSDPLDLDAELARDLAIALSIVEVICFAASKL